MLKECEHDSMEALRGHTLRHLDIQMLFSQEHDYAIK